MAVPIGTWEYHSEGPIGQVIIPSLDTTGNFIGEIDFPDGSIAQIVGFWNAVAKQITFTNVTALVPRDFICFLGDNHPDQVLVLAGWYEDKGFPPPRTQFGWYALQPQH